MLLFIKKYLLINLMANKTDPLAKSIHGSNPQFLIEQIMRQKIY